MINKTVSYYNNADDSRSKKSVITLIMSWG